MNYLYVTDLLEGEYAEVFKKAEKYSMMISLDTDIQNEYMMNLADLLLTAQKKNRPVEKIVGKDQEKFCVDYFSGVTFKDRVKAFSKRVYYALCVVFILEFLYLILNIESLNESTNILVPLLIGFSCGTFIDFIGTVVFKRLFIKYRKTFSKLYYAFIIVSLLATGFIGAYGTDILDITIPAYSVLIISGIYVIPYTAVILYKKLRLGEIFYNEERKQKRAFKDAQHKREAVKTWINMYNSKNKRLAQKGKTTITKEEYMEKLYKKHRYGTKERVLFFAFMVCILICLLVPDEFENGWWDRALFLLINLAIEIPIIRFFDRLSLLNYSILLKCKEDGIDIFEYQERM